MAVDMFLDLDGIEGEAQDAKHAKEIDVLAWSWGSSQSESKLMGGSRRSGKVDVQDLSFTHYIDSATHLLWQRVFDGKHISEGTLVVRKAGGTPLDYFIIKITDVLVTSVSNGGSGGEDRLTENVTLNFRKVEIDYVPQKADGSGEAPKKAGWDIAENKSTV